MACNENIIKNVANEISRNCLSQNVNIDPEFVIFLIDLLLLNPKYGKLFSKTLSRASLEYFVNECVKILTGGATWLNTLKMQFIIQTNYDKLQNLIDKQLDSIDTCLRPLVTEIVECDPDLENDHELKKLYRKISIYIILASGLGNPSFVITLKEGLAALDSVFSLDDLKMFIGLNTEEKVARLNELMEITSGVRLFNRDCKKGGEVIPDLPFNLVDAGKACLASLSNSLITVMQRVNSLTTAIEDTVSIQDETGNTYIDIPPNSDLTVENYKQIFELLIFNRQYELFIRKLMTDVETMVLSGNHHVERIKVVLEELHAAVKYKAAVPVVTVFPLFSKLWQVWRAMQNIMFLISTVNRLMTSLSGIQEQMMIPYNIIDKMLKGKQVLSDQDRMNKLGVEQRLCLCSLPNYIANNESNTSLKEKQVKFLGFCSLCLTVGALVPSNVKIGWIKFKGQRYGFCNVKMALKFNNDPQRYVNEVLHYARNNPHIINMLNIVEDVYNVKNIDNLITIYLPKIKVFDKDIQTETHPIEEYIDKDYSWDLWEWKRRACKWANIVNCRTHGTQTKYSHMRSEIHCQTHELRDKWLQTKKDCGVNTVGNNVYKWLQTKKDCGVNTVGNNVFLWGLRGNWGNGQHAMDLGEKHSIEKKKAQDVVVCDWPCTTPKVSRKTI